MLFSCLPIAGALLPDSPVKFLLQGAGNIWQGFVICFSDIFIILSLVLRIVSMVAHQKKKGAWHIGVLIAGDVFTSSYGGLQHPVEFAALKENGAAITDHHIVFRRLILIAL